MYTNKNIFALVTHIIISGRYFEKSLAAFNAAFSVVD